MNRQEIAARNRRLIRLSSPTRRKIKEVFKDKVLKPFLRKSEGVKDKKRLLQILTGVLMNADYAEKITKIRIEDNKIGYFAGAFSRELLRIKAKNDIKKNP